MLEKKPILMLCCCIFGFLIIQPPLFLIIEHYDDVTDAKRDVRRAQKAVVDAKTALEECKKKHAQQPQHHFAHDLCLREKIKLTSAETFLSYEEATLKDRKAPLLLIGVPLVIGIILVGGSIVWAIIIKRRDGNRVPVTRETSLQQEKATESFVKDGLIIWAILVIILILTLLVTTLIYN